MKIAQQLTGSQYTARGSTAQPGIRVSPGSRLPEAFGCFHLVAKCRCQMPPPAVSASSEARRESVANVGRRCAVYRTFLNTSGGGSLSDQISAMEHLTEAVMQGACTHVRPQGRAHTCPHARTWARTHTQYVSLLRNRPAPSHPAI